MKPRNTKHKPTHIRRVVFFATVVLATIGCTNAHADVQAHDSPALGDPYPTSVYWGDTHLHTNSCFLVGPSYGAFGVWLLGSDHTILLNSHWISSNSRCSQRLTARFQGQNGHCKLAAAPKTRAFSSPFLRVLFSPPKRGF